jgi:hypothetical protein
MRRNPLIALILGSVVGLLLLGLLFPPGRKTYSADLGALRARFNEDAGKVRLLLLLSPT